MGTSNKKTKSLVGRAEQIFLPQHGTETVPARIDTGAKTSSLWASNIEVRDGVLYYTFFDKGSPLYTGERHQTTQFEKTVVASSIGETQERYKVQVLVTLKGRKIRGRFTLSDRSKQVYPVLIGRNILRGKFVVDVQEGKSLYQEERQRSKFLQSKLAP